VNTNDVTGKRVFHKIVLTDPVDCDCGRCTEEGPTPCCDADHYYADVLEEGQLIDVLIVCGACKRPSMWDIPPLALQILEENH
jgi:hypothetical protein